MADHLRRLAACSSDVESKCAQVDPQHFFSPAGGGVGGRVLHPLISVHGLIGLFFLCLGRSPVGDCRYRRLYIDIGGILQIINLKALLSSGGLLRALRITERFPEG